MNKQQKQKYTSFVKKDNQNQEIQEQTMQKDFKEKIIDLDDFKNRYDEELTLLKMQINSQSEKEIYIEKVREFLEGVAKEDENAFYAYLYEISLDKKRVEIFYDELFKNDNFSDYLFLLKKAIISSSSHNPAERIFIQDKNNKGEIISKELQLYIPPLETIVKKYLGEEEISKEKKDLLLFLKTRIEHIKTGHLICGIDDLTCKIYYLQDNLDETIMSSKNEIIESVNKVSSNIINAIKDDTKKVNEKEEKEDENIALNNEIALLKDEILHLEEKIPSEKINEIHINTENIKFELESVKEGLNNILSNNSNNENSSIKKEENPENLEFLKDRILDADAKLEKIIKLQQSQKETESESKDESINDNFINEIKNVFSGLEQKLAGIEQKMSNIENSVNEVKEFISQIDTEEVKMFIKAENEALKKINSKLNETKNDTNEGEK